MTNAPSGILHLLPSPLTPYSADNWSLEALQGSLPMDVIATYRRLAFFVVESERSAMRLLSRLKSADEMRKVELRILNEHSQDSDICGLLKPMIDGMDCGFFSEAGMPCIADPGAALVAAAHRARIRVIPAGGASSILLALAASGLDAQRFAFLGYLPPDKAARGAAIERLGKETIKDGMTRIFIETPYRNSAVLEDCVRRLHSPLWLTVAENLSDQNERIRSGPVEEWKTNLAPTVEKVPAVFLFGLQALIKPRNTR